MATKTSDAILRIRAKNLSKKDLQGVASDLDAIADSQQRNATAADKAAGAVRGLVAEQRALKTVAADLAKRRALIERIIGTPAEMKKAADRVREMTQELDELRRMKAAGTFMGDINKAIRNVEGNLKRANREVEKQHDAFQGALGAARAMGMSLNDMPGELTKVNELLNRTENMTRAARAAEVAHEAAVRQTNTQLEKQAQAKSEIASKNNSANEARSLAFQQRLLNVLNEHAAKGNRLVEINERKERSTRGHTAAVDRNTRSLDRNNRATGIFADTGRKSLSVYQRMRGQLLSLAAAYIGFHEAIRLVRDSFAIQQERIGIDLQLRVANDNDIALAAKDVAFLRAEADRLGLVYEEIAKHYANYKIAAKAVGAGNTTINESFTEAVEIVTALRLPTETAGNVFRAFTQILGKNRVQAEELRNQLGDALPGAVAEFAKSLQSRGIIKATSDLESYFKKGEGNIKHFFDFLSDYAKKTEGQVEAASKTTLSGVRRLINTYRDFLVDFQTSGADKAIGEAVDAISNALKGEDGKKFAQDLAAAFGALAKIVVVLIKNFDAVLIVLKAFLALQLAKGIYGIYGALRETGRAVLASGNGFAAWTKNVVTARKAGDSFGKIAKGMIPGIGLLGIAVAALAGVFYLLKRRVDSSLERMEKFGQTVDAIREAQSTADLSLAVADANTELDASIAKVKELRKLGRERWINPNAVKALMAEGVALPGDLERRINEELARQAGLRDSITVAQRKQIRLAKEEAAIVSDPDNFDLSLPTEDDKGGAARENKRLNTARAIQKELLQLDQDILAARLQGEDTTAAEVADRYALEMDRISAMIDERRLKLEQLAQDAASAGIAETMKAEIAAMETRLQQLQAHLNQYALEENLAAQIAFHQKEINDEIALRDGRIEAINHLVEAGVKSEVEGLREITAERQRAAGVIGTTITTLVTFLNSIEDEALRKALGVDKLLEDMAFLQIQIRQTETTLDLVKKNLAGQLSQGIAAAMGTLAQGLAAAIQQTDSLSDAFKGAADSFLNFIADFLVGIGQAIMQAILLEAILRAMGGGTGGSYADIAMGALTRHNGGLVGRNTGNTRRKVSPLVFAGAQRFHSGGLPGLRPNEVPIIAKKGEEVLNESDPRNVLNGGMSGGGAPNIDLSIVNTIDPAEVVRQAAGTAGGRKAIINVIASEAPAVRRLLGVNR